MTSTLKLYGGIALLILLGLMAWGVKNWDDNRMTREYDRGVNDERGLWVASQFNANQKAMGESNTATVASEGVADQARTEASTTTAASAAANQSTVEKITYAYASAPPVACRSDAGPGALPGGVLEGLSEARSAALGGSPAPTGRLQPAQRE